MGFDATPPTAQPPPPAPPPAPPAGAGLLRLGRSAKGTRLSASALLLLSIIVLAVSLTVPWWGASLSGGGTSGTIGFVPGSSYFVTGTFGTGAAAGTYAYSSTGLLHVGELYEAVLGVGLLAILAGLAAMVLGYLGASGTFRSRKYLSMTLLLTLISLVGAALLPGMVALAQPAAFNADGSGFGGTGGSGCGTGSNPCNSFWGSISGGGATYAWGAGVGWYLSIAAAVLLALALVQLITSRSQPYTRDEMWAASSRPPTTLTLGDAAPPSPPGATSSGGGSPPPGQSTTGYCPRCGNPMTWIPQYSRDYCLTERTYL